MSDEIPTALFLVRDLAVDLYRDPQNQQWLVIECRAVSIGALTCQETKKPRVQVELQRGGPAQLEALKVALRALITVTE